jgi:predicted negative regulator of RcsB-dependent stress response
MTEPNVEQALLSVARESIVLITVVILAILVILVWQKFLKPFVDRQTEIATAQADALRSIQETSKAATDMAREQQLHARHTLEASNNLMKVSNALLESKFMCHADRR